MIKLISIFLFLVLPILTYGQNQNYWLKKADFAGLKRERAVAFSIQNKGYITSGVDTTDVTRNDLWEFDASTNSWTQKADLPGSTRRNAIGFSINNIGYVGTGMDSSNANVGTVLKDFWAYDPQQNLWSQKSDFPGAGGTGIYFATAFVLDGKGYICGGKKGPADYSSELWEYKPINDTWIQKQNFPGGLRYQIASFTVENKAYVGMGVDEDVYRKDIWQYNPATGNWLEKNDFPGGVRGAVCTFSIKQRGFVCLGGDGGYKKDLWEYNPFSDSWLIRSQFEGSARKNAIAFTIGDYAYVGTGKGVSGKKMSFYQYIPYETLNINSENNSFSVYPTYIESNFFYVNSNENADLKIVDLAGKIIFRQYITNQENIIRPPSLPQGVYILIISSGQKNHPFSQKIIIN